MIPTSRVILPSQMIPPKLNDTNQLSGTIQSNDTTQLNDTNKSMDTIYLNYNTQSIYGNKRYNLFKEDNQTGISCSTTHSYVTKSTTHSYVTKSSIVRYNEPRKAHVTAKTNNNRPGYLISPNRYLISPTIITTSLMSSNSNGIPENSISLNLHLQSPLNTPLLRANSPT